MNKIILFYYFIFLTFSNAIAQKNAIPAYIVTPPERVFKAIVKAPTFQGGQKGFQRWVKFALSDTLLIQSMLQKGTLQVIWTVQPVLGSRHKAEETVLTVICADRNIQQQVQQVFEKMPLWKYHIQDWLTIIGTNTLATVRPNPIYEHTTEKIPVESTMLNPKASILLFQYRVPDSIKQIFLCRLNTTLGYDCKQTFPDSIIIKSHQVYSDNNMYFIRDWGCLFWYVPPMRSLPYEVLDIHLEDYLAERGRFNPQEIMKDQTAFLKKLKQLINAKEMEVDWELAPYRDLTNKIQVVTFSKRAARFRPEVERVLTEFKAHRLYQCKTGSSSRGVVRLGKDLEIWVMPTKGF